MDNDALLALLQADGDIVTERLDHWARTRADRVFLHYAEARITHTHAEFGRLSDHIASGRRDGTAPSPLRDLPRTPTNKIEKYKLREQILDERGHSPS